VIYKEVKKLRTVDKATGQSDWKVSAAQIISKYEHARIGPPLRSLVLFQIFFFLSLFKFFIRLYT
jgi:hypothetical protein